MIDELMIDPTQWAGQARVVPAIRAGETIGFKLYAIRRDSIPQAFGPHNGDLLTTLNEKKLDSIEAAMGVYAEQRTSERLTVAYKRKGTSETIEITVHS